MNSEKQEHDSDEKKEQSNTHPLFKKNPSPEEASGNIEDPTKEKKEHWIQLAMIILSLGTLIAYILVSIIQNNKIRESLDISNKALIETQKAQSISEQALNKADTANFYTRQAFNHSIESDRGNEIFRKNDIVAKERATKLELRAYVSIIDIKLKYFGAGHDGKLIMRVLNTGRTPAYKLSEWGSFKIGGEVDEKDISKFEKPSNIAEDITIGSGIRSEIITNIYIPDNIIENVKSNRQKFYLWGSLFYRDIFGELHRTRHYSIYIPTDSTFIAYGRYNDAN